MPTTSKRRRLLRLSLFLAGNLVFTALLACLAFLFGWARFAAGLPDLHAWHTDRPASEFRAEDAEEVATLDGYMAREARVFDELEAMISGPWGDEPRDQFMRYSPGSVCNPATDPERNWNRTYMLEAPSPRGAALLLHGLSDSPYSLRAFGRRLHREGYTVVGLRLPGHGTCPGALAAVSERDWAACVKLAAADLRRRVPEGPLVLVGYSAGGALSIGYAIDCVRDASTARPDAIVLFSPMIGITSMAQATEYASLAARITGEPKILWSGVQAEVDPYKYCSWPMNASVQAWRLTRRVNAGMAALEREKRTGELPPILAFQSAVDSTIIAPALVSTLFDRLQPRGHSLVLFDVNRASFLDNLLNRSFEKEFITRLSRTDLPFSLTVVTNVTTDSQEVLSRTRDAGTITESPLGIAWPPGIFSLSHGSLPFRPDDPIVGTAEATSARGLPLGSLNLRGEHGVLTISESFMVRLRHNPFYDFTESRAVDWLNEVTEAQDPREPTQEHPQ